MAITLALIALDIPHYGMYKHTGGACMLPKDPAPPICRRFHMRPNILWPSERPREQPRVSCPSVHMCEPNESLLPVQMTGSMCAVMGPSGQRAEWVRVEKYAPCVAVSARAGPGRSCTRWSCAAPGRSRPRAEDLEWQRREKKSRANSARLAPPHDRVRPRGR